MNTRNDPENPRLQASVVVALLIAAALTVSARSAAAETRQPGARQSAAAIAGTLDTRAMLRSKPDWNKILAPLPADNVFKIGFAIERSVAQGRAGKPPQLSPSETRALAEYRADMKKARKAYLRLGRSKLEKQRIKESASDKDVLARIQAKYRTQRAEFLRVVLSSPHLPADAKAALEALLQRSVDQTGVAFGELVPTKQLSKPALPAAAK